MSATANDENNSALSALRLAEHELFKHFIGPFRVAYSHGQEATVAARPTDVQRRLAAWANCDQFVGHHGHVE